MKRLESQDFTYWFMHRAFDWSVVLQLVWTFPRPIPAAELRAMNDALAAGPLNRRVIDTVVPVARPRWSHAADCPDVMCDTEPIASRSAEAWAAAELDTVPLDPETGPAWRLRSVATVEGGQVLSLCALHLVTDGRGLVTAAADAVAAITAVDPLPVDPLPVDTGISPRSVVLDCVDAVAGVVEAGAGLAAAATGLLRSAVSTVRTGTPRQPVVAAPTRSPRTPTHLRAPRARTSWAIVSVSATDLAAAAARHGGTVNTLFIALVSGALRSAGTIGPQEPLKVGIPVDQRGVDDDRANATAGVSVMVTGDVTPGEDLGALRRECKRAYTELAAGERAMIVHLQPALRLLPLSVVVAAVTAGNGMPDVMTSNIGVFDDDVATIAGVRATGMAFRGDAIGVEPDKAYRFGDGVQAWLLQAGEQVTISVAGFDESAFPDSPTLRSAVEEQFDGWGVVHRIW